MKPRALLFSAAAVLFVAVVSYAANDVFMGTWKLNEAKSRLSPSTGQNTTVVYAPAGDSVRLTRDGTGPSGQPTHSEWMGKFDGMDYAVTGDATYDTLAIRMVSDHILSGTLKKGGNVIATYRVVVSPDGRSRTVTFTGTDANGMKTTSTAVYEKQ